MISTRQKTSQVREITFMGAGDLRLNRMKNNEVRSAVEVEVLTSTDRQFK